MSKQKTRTVVLSGPFDFIRRKIKQVRKSAKRVTIRPDWKRIAATASAVGPIVGALFPAAAPLLAVATGVTNAAVRGDPNALKKINAVNLAAQAGVPQAVELKGALDAAKQIVANQKATSILKGAQMGDPAAAALIAEIVAGAQAGDPGSIALAKALLAAKKGAENGPAIVAAIAAPPPPTQTLSPYQLGL